MQKITYNNKKIKKPKKKKKKKHRSVQSLIPKMRFGTNIDYKKKKNILPLRVGGFKCSKRNRKSLRVSGGELHEAMELFEETQEEKDAEWENQNDVEEEEEKVK